MTVTARLDEPAAVTALQEARERTHRLVAAVSDADLQRVHSTLMSPLVWDLGHIAAFEDLWIVHRYGERPLLREGMAEIYDAFETPRAGRGELDFLGPDEAREYLAAVRERTLDVIAQRGVGDQVGDRESHARHSDLQVGDRESHARHSDLGTICELVLRHEHQHNETMLQTMQLAHLPGPTEAAATGRELRPAAALTGLETIAVPAAVAQIGAGSDGFAYDNERPRHAVSLAAYEIGRVPVTNGAFAEFVAAGGYERPELWTPAGWLWREAAGACRPLHWSADLGSEWRLSELVTLDPARPVAHVSWFEADAFARSHGARLPTEAEWEHAAAGIAAGDGPARPGHHANLDQLAGGPVAVGSLPAGASAVGCEQLLGDVWEWTGSRFDGYPGFSAFPYREYSEVFFGDEYRVLRGGSWATRPRVATAAFRNWDLPQRRQIFSGLRIARDA